MKYRKSTTNITLKNQDHVKNDLDRIYTILAESKRSKLKFYDPGWSFNQWNSEFVSSIERNPEALIDWPVPSLSSWSWVSAEVNIVSVCILTGSRSSNGALCGPTMFDICNVWIENPYSPNVGFFYCGSLTECIFSCTTNHPEIRDSSTIWETVADGLSISKISK